MTRLLVPDLESEVLKRSENDFYILVLFTNLHTVSDTEIQLEFLEDFHLIQFYRSFFEDQIRRQL